MGSRSRASALLERVEDGERSRALVEGLTALRDADDALVRRRAAEGLYRIATDRPSLLVEEYDALFDALREAGTTITGAVVTFEYLSRNPPPALADHVDELEEFLTAPDPTVREVACRALGKLAIDHRTAVAPLAPRLATVAENDPVPTVRATACYALGVCEHRTPAVDRALQAAANDPRGDVRRAARWAMDRLDDPDVRAWEQGTIDELDPAAFERLLSDLWDAKGYETEVTPATRDGGLDVSAERHDRRVAIEAKHRDGRPVGVRDVRQVAAQLARGYDRAVLVTNTAFTADAREFAADAAGVELVDGTTLRRQLETYRITPPP